LRPAFREAEKTYRRWETNADGDPRIMLGWRPPKARAGPKPAVRTPEEFRAFSLDKTYEQHRDLVEKLFDLKVLDPAMGSGHFLVEAVDFVTDELLHFLNAFPTNPVNAALARTRESILESLESQGLQMSDAERDEWRRKLTDVHLLKRRVLKRCIYGVDLNPLATELAKVSLWLDAFTLNSSSEYRKCVTPRP
jgi:type II restriction/modification system DNA methylase subunit YeeA